MATPIPANRARFSLRQIAEACGARLLRGVPDMVTQGVTTDSRTVAPGALFVALPGDRYDGHAFIDTAFKAGAAAVLVERAESVPASVPVLQVPDARHALGDLAASHRQSWHGRLVAITGSAGKTTTKELTAAALREGGATVLATSGNLNNLIGVPMSLFLLSDADDLAVLELGSSAPGEIARLAAISRPDVGVVTSVAIAHTAGIGSLQAVAEEKVALVRALSVEGIAVFSADSEIIRPLVRDIGAKRRLSFGRAPGADVHLASYTLDACLRSRARFEIAKSHWAAEAALGLLGEAAAVDAAAALAVTLALLGPARLDQALAGLSRVQPSAGRMHPVAGFKHTYLLDDTYNSNPASALASLQTARQLAKIVGGRLIAILGDMAELGECSLAEHEKIGREAVKLGAAVLVACGQEMAAAAGAARREAAETRGPLPIEVVQAENSEQAIGPARALLRERDVVLVKGSRCMAMESVLHALQEESVP
jgi:UDP-N-acetylmuramoyl-tripeptide--D-alanyl-D-alanine ligase